MKMTVVFRIVDEIKEEVVTVKAHSKDDVSIFIFAASLEKAQELLPQGREAALDAVKDWEPSAPEDKPQHHYPVCSKSIEDMEEDWRSFEDSPHGQRFIKRIERAKSFENRHNKTEFMSVVEFYHLANKYQNNLLNGSFDVAALAYRHGYRHGMASAYRSGKIANR